MATQLQLKSLLASLVCGIVDGVARLVSDEVGAYRSSLTDRVTSVPACLELDLPSSLELLRAAERGRWSSVYS